MNWKLTILGIWVLAITVVSCTSEPSTFTIVDIVTDWDSTNVIEEIEATDINIYFSSVYYSKYLGDQQEILRTINAIDPQTGADYTSDKSCYKINQEEFNSYCIEKERMNNTSFYWAFEHLEEYSIYKCVKAPYRHLIVFDSNSDTAYHRVESLRN